ncbi:MAG: hypothetical protein ACSHX9_15585 [Luteolibacter sp.]
MRFLPLHALILLAPFASANEALDVLEGKIDANSIVLPPPPYKEVEEDANDVGELIYLAPQWAPSPLDSIWSRSVLYDSAANPWVQQVAITGYFDFQASFGKSDIDASGATPARNADLEGTRTRRARLGARIRAFNNTEFEAVGEFAGSDEYSGIDRLKGYTQLSDTTGITYGKFRPNFGTESGTEQQFSPYFNRTATSDMFAPASSLGASIHHAGEEYDYDIGWFSSDYSADLPSVEGDGFLNFSISRAYVEKNGDSLARVRWHADYIHNFDPGKSNPAGYNLAGQFSANGAQVIQNPAYRHLFSTGFAIDSDRYQVTADFNLANGNTTVWGMSVGGSYWVMPGTLKLVGRYQYAGSDDARAIATTFGNSGGLRYDDSPFFVGDEYHSLYFGANLHLYKDGLIIRNGLEYSILKDEVGSSFNTEAFSWRTGASLSF